ncbi:MAG: tetratricopeptide repeat protein [Planctomycetota bacterium]|jgi:tetratricopeptide (TPR) repeat protein
MINQCSRCHLEIPKDFPETDGRLCPTCYKKAEGECMHCGASPVEIVEFRRVYGLVALGFTGGRIVVLCADCTRRVVMKNLLYTAFFGWVGITPFYKSFVGQRVNLRSLFKHPSLPPATKPLVTLLAYIVPIAAVLVLAGFLLFRSPVGDGTRPFAPLSEKAANLKDEARRELRAGHPDRAELLYRKALLEAPENPVLRLGLGQALERQGKREAAEVEYRRSLVPVKGMSFPGGRQSLGLLLLRTGRAKEAAEVLGEEVALNTDPIRNVLALHKLYQDALAASGRRGEALALYRDRLRKLPDSAALLYLVGRFEARENPEGAIERFREAMKKDETFFEPIYAMGKVYLEIGDWTQARAAFEKALGIRAKSRQTLFSLGEALCYGGEPELAKARFAELAEAYPKSPLAPLGLARLELWQGNADASIPHLNSAGILAPGGYHRAEVFRGIGEAYSLQGKLEDAVLNFKEAMELSIEEEQLALAAFWYAEASLRLAGEDERILWERAADGSVNAWTAKVARFLLGETTKEAFLSSFEEKSFKAWAPFASYFAGLRARLEGKAEAAKVHFDSAAAMGPGYLKALVRSLRKD